jgi:hypothetical protein
MTTISKDAKLVTFINVFTVEPAKQQLLVSLRSAVRSRTDLALENLALRCWW